MEFLSLLYTVLLVAICLQQALLLYRSGKPAPRQDDEALKEWVRQQLDAQSKLFAQKQAELARQKYALVLANIVADVIIPLSARAGEFLDTDGVFLCSGIIDTRAGEVEAALERNGLAVFERREQNGWVALAARAAR